MKEYQNVFKKKYPQAILLGGLPASGKSTLTKEFEGFFVISKDDVRHKLACIQHGYQPETLFDPNVLQSYSNSVHIILEMVAYIYTEFLHEDNTLQIMNDVNHRLGHYFKTAKVNITKLEAFNCICQYSTEIFSNKYPRGIVFEATFITPKQRASIINYINNKLPISCVFIDIPSDIAFEHTLNRSKKVIDIYKDTPVYGRFVPLEVIQGMERSTVLPSKAEGFDNVYIICDYLPEIEHKKSEVVALFEKFNEFDEKKVAELFPSYRKTIAFNQENSHHILTLDMHQLLVAKYVHKRCQSFCLFIASLLHDVGKVDTKTFYVKLAQPYNGIKEGKKFVLLEKRKDCVFVRETYAPNTYIIPLEYVIIDQDAHYYNHQNISALKVRRELLAYGFSLQIVNEVYNYILYHMYIPFDAEINKRILTTLGKHFSYEGIKNLLLIRQADVQTTDTEENNLIRKNKDILNQYI